MESKSRLILNGDADVFEAAVKPLIDNLTGLNKTLSFLSKIDSGHVLAYKINRTEIINGIYEMIKKDHVRIMNVIRSMNNNVMNVDQ